MSNGRLFGVCLDSEQRWVSRLAPAAGVPSLRFRFVDAPSLLNWRDAPFIHGAQTADGDELFTLAQVDDCTVLHYAAATDFFVWPDRIDCHLLNPARRAMVEIHFLGAVMSFWLERQGIPALHASAVVVDDRAVVFASNNGGGKSSIAATLMQSGYPLLSDDIVPVERHKATFVGRPGYPTMRMWPQEAMHFLGHYTELPLVHPRLDKRRVFVGPPDGFGEFCDKPMPLACIYLPERQDASEHGSEVAITPLSGAEAVVELVRHSFVARLVQAAGLQARRMHLFAALVRRVPVRRLAYPSGFEHLSRVCDAVINDVGAPDSRGEK